MTIAKRVGLGLLAILLCGIAAVGVAARHEGYRIYVIHTGSMVPTLKLGDIVIDKPAGQLHRGEIITFRHSATSNVIVTHRIKSIRNGEITTKGDANPTPDAWTINRHEVEGTVVADAPRLGYVFVFLKQPAGIGAVMTAVLAVILLWELFFPAAPTLSLLRDAATTPDASRGGISRLRGPGRVRRSELGAVDALRTTALTSTS